MPAFNPALGDTRIQAVTGEEYILRFDFNALCAVEDRIGCKIGEMEDRLAEPSMRDLRAFLACGLQRHHPDMTEDAAGELFHPGGIADAIGAALTAAFGDPTGAAPADPPMAAGGTSGPASPRGQEKPKTSGSSGG